MVARLSKLLNAIASWRYFYWAVFAACAVPALLILYSVYLAFWGGDPLALTSDPTKELLHDTGEYSLGLLLVTLSVTPVRRLFKVNRIQTVRRMLGIWAFFYALAHVSIYLTLDRLCYSPSSCDLAGIGADIVKRPFIWAGLTAFTCMTALAVTSTNGWIRRLKKKWQPLHRLVYLAGAAAVVHYIWIQKSDISEPLKYAAILAVLLLIRVYLAWQKRRSVGARPVAAAS